MKRIIQTIGLAMVVGCATSRVDIEPLPVAVSNNAVAAVESGGRARVYSMLGIGESKRWDAITTSAFELELSSGQWRRIPDVPGGEGRIAATAVGVRGRVYLFGGYTVAENGEEVSLAVVDIYDPGSETWKRGADIPVPVDDSVSGVYRNRWVYLVSGWSMNDNIPDVQVYDIVENRWVAATPIPGTPVFGHSGGIVGDTIVYCDGAYRGPQGAKPRYRPSDECWMGRIDGLDMTRIEWSRIDGHPGSSRYRAAAGASTTEGRVYFTGGTDNPYNIDGVGYDGVPSEPVAMAFAWDARSETWILVDDAVKHPTMDHRGLIVVEGRRIVVGGMERGQVVTSKVSCRR